MRGFSSAVPSRGKSERMSDICEVLEWPTDGNYLQGRFVGPVFSIKQVWFTIATEQRPAPKGVSIPKMCIDWDGVNDVSGGDFCPYRKSGLGREGKEYWVNFIVRDLQDKDFPVPTGKKENHLDYEAYWAKGKSDAKKTPVRLLRIPDSQIEKIQNLTKANKEKNKKTGDWVSFELSHPRFGRDVAILENPKAKGAARFDIQMRDRAALKEEETEYLLWRPDLLKPDTLEAAKAELDNLRSKLIHEEDDNSSSAPTRGSNTRKNTARPSARAQEADDELIDLSEEDLEDHSEDRYNDRPTNTQRRPNVRSTTRDDEDDIIDDGNDDLDSDLEEIASTPSRTTQRRRPVEDDIDDMDDDPPPAARKTSSNTRPVQRPVQRAEQRPSTGQARRPTTTARPAQRRPAPAGDDEDF